MGRFRTINRYLALLLFVLLNSPLGRATASAQDSAIPFRLPPITELSRIQNALIETSRGPIYLELYPREAPWHVANFKYLADKGFYRGTIFHLARENYLVQGGDPTGTGKGGPNYTLPPEFTGRKHVIGSLGMARVRGDKNPERRSNGSQFHILLRDSPRLDGDFTVFGKVVNGMDVVRRLQKGDMIRNITVYVTP